MASSYTDIDAILAEETNIPVTFRTPSTGLGRALDPGADEDNMQNGAKLELPLWMTRNMANRNMVALHTPAVYGDRMRRRLRAGAAVEDLQGRCPYFYDVGQQLAGCDPTDESLPALLLETFQTRYKELLTKGHSKGENAPEVSDIQQRLTCEEAALFQAARASSVAAQRWRNSDLLSASKNGRAIGKRKAR